MKTEADEKASCSSKKGGDASSSFDIDHILSTCAKSYHTHRIDQSLVVTLGLLYCMSQIDRGSLGNAPIAGSGNRKT